MRLWYKFYYVGALKGKVGSVIESEAKFSQLIPFARASGHVRALKEESKVANCDWVDHQACCLLQYINVIANLFIMGIVLMSCAERL